MKTCQKVLFILLFLFLCIPRIHALDRRLLYDREYAREEFELAQFDKEKTFELVDQLDEAFFENDDYPAVNIAYYGAVKRVEAKFTFNPLRKLDLLRRALHWLDIAVERDRDDLEVRFVRFATLHHLPPVLGIGKTRAKDIEDVCWLLLARDYSVVSYDVQIEMIEFMLGSRRLNKKLKADLEKLLDELFQP